MLFNLPVPVLCVLCIFYGYGACALFTGKAWTRTGQLVTGTPARVGGFAVIVVGVLFTVSVYHPERQDEVAATLCLWLLTVMFWGWVFGRREDQAGRFPHIPSERKSKRKRKNDEWY